MIYHRLDIGGRSDEHKYPYGKSKREQIIRLLTVELPFSVYFGWLSVASCANLAICFYTILDKSQIRGFWLEGQAIALFVVIAIATISMVVFRRDAAYAFVVCWALIAISIKQFEYKIIFFMALTLGVLSGITGLVCVVLRFLAFIRGDDTKGDRTLIANVDDVRDIPQELSSDSADENL